MDWMDPKSSDFELTDDIKDDIERIVADEVSIRLSELKERVDFAGMDHILAAIKQGVIYAPLEEQELSNHEQFWVYPDAETARSVEISRQTVNEDFHPPSLPITVDVGRSLLWEETEWTISDLEEDVLFLWNEDQETEKRITHDRLHKLVRDGTVRSPKPTNGQGPWDLMETVLDRLKIASQKQIRKANVRWWRARPYIQGKMNSQEAAESWNETRRKNQFTDQNLDEVTDRTIRNDKRDYEEGKAQSGVGYVGLLPDFHRRGRDSSLSKELQKLIKEVIEDNYAIREAPSAVVAYQHLVKECKERGIAKPARSTFYRYIQKWNEQELVRCRRGEIPSRSVAPPRRIRSGSSSWATRAFQSAHIDTKPCDVILVHPDTGKPMGQPNLTVLIDSFSRRILGSVVGFREPSRQAHMLVIRESVRRFQRLPETIVFDNSKSAHSDYVQSLLARYKVNLALRPPYEPKFGSEIERFFRTFQNQLTVQLEGNFVNHDREEKTRAENDPNNRALWTLERFYEMVRFHAYEDYDTQPHSGIDAHTPRTAFAESIKEHGQRPHRIIPYDENFIFQSMIPVDGTTRTVQGYGISVKNIQYHNDIMAEKDIPGSEVPVRYDPFDVSTVYAWIDNSWVPCRSKYWSELKGVTRTEREKASRELRDKRTKKGSNLDERELIDYIVQQREKLKDGQTNGSSDASKRNQDQIVSEEILGDGLDYEPDESNGTPSTEESDEDETDPDDLPGFSSTSLDD